MQINLIPKTRELEQKKNQTSSLIFLMGVSILATVGILSFVLFSINLARKNEVKGLETKIGGIKGEIAKYEKPENKARFIVNSVGEIKTILGERKDWNLLLTEIQNLMPRESWLLEVNFDTEGKITFKTQAKSAAKVSEFIESLRTHEIEIPESILDDEKELDLTKESTDNNSDETATEEDKTTENSKFRRVRLFKDVNISNYSKSAEEGNVYFNFEVEATYVEDIWTKSK